jgi:hypothetical protein
MRWAGHVARIGEKTGVYRVLVGKPGGKRPLGRPRCRWQDNIKIDLWKMGGGRDWIDLAEITGSCKYGNEPSGFIRLGKI